MDILYWSRFRMRMIGRCVIDTNLFRTENWKEIEMLIETNFLIPFKVIYDNMQYATQAKSKCYTTMRMQI